MTILTDAELGEIRERLERAGDDTASWAYDRDVRALLAHIDAVKAASVSAPAVGWQPIETAPLDAHILFAHHESNRWRGAVRMGFVHSDYNGHKRLVTEDGRGGWAVSPQPTLWHPMPDAPFTPTAKES